MSRQTKEIAEIWIANNAPKYKLIDWGGGLSFKSRFLNTDSFKYFSCSFSAFKHALQKNPNHEFASASRGNSLATSEREATEWLNKNIPHIKLIDWAGRATKKSKFLNTKLDTNKGGRIFFYIFSSMKYEVENKRFIEYGLSISEARKKARETNKERYGHEYASQNEEIKNKIFTTNIERFGSKNPNSSKEVRKKIEETNIKIYGFRAPSMNDEIKGKIRESCIRKYGASSPAKADIVKIKIDKTRRAKGLTKVFDGKTMKELAKERNVSYTNFKKTVQIDGFDFAKDLSSKKTSIETKIEQILKELNLDYVHNNQLSGCKYRPDFVIESNKLIIECDGVYWHSDAVNKNNNHLIEKRKTYTSLGYTPLFFREDEIRNKLNIVKSIIKNKLGLSKRVFARKCTIQRELDKSVCNKFFDENHLMGKGSGRTYSLRFNEEIVAALQVKNSKQGIEISRFCTLNDVSVVGGFSRLISFVENNESPHFIKTFVDMRYGQGDYLLKLGFTKKTEYPSFVWVNGINTHHRLIFKGNSGYSHDFFKLWDAGQSKYIKNI